MGLLDVDTLRKRPYDENKSGRAPNRSGTTAEKTASSRLQDGGRSVPGRGPKNGKTRDHPIGCEEEAENAPKIAYTPQKNLAAASHRTASALAAKKP